MKILCSKNEIYLEAIRFQVSNGAELIMLSRRFFLKHASATVKKYVREIAHPFPTEGALQDNLQTNKHWDEFRKDIVKDIVTQRSQEKTLQAVVWHTQNS